MSSLTQAFGPLDFSRRRVIRIPAAIVIAATCLFVRPAVAACSGAAIATNAATARPEKVWQEHDGQDFEIKHAESVSGAWINETQLTFDAIDQSCPALGFATDGSTAVVWKSATTPSQIFYRERQLLSGTWTWQPAAVAVSDGGYAASTPFVAFHGGVAWVAWREAGAGGTTRIVVANEPGGEPWPSTFTRHLLATISDPGNTALDLNSESGNLWATWIASPTSVQYAEWDENTSTWSYPAAIAIENGNVLAAKALARTNVLN